MKKTIATITLAGVLFCASTIPAYAKLSSNDANIIGGIISILGNSQSKNKDTANNATIQARSYHHIKNLSNLDKMFITALNEKDYATMQDMLNSGVDINGVFNMQQYGAQTAFFIALERNDRTTMQFLLERGADVTGYYDFQKKHRSYFVMAAERENLDLTKYLHAWGAGINECSDDDYYGSPNALNGVSHIYGATNLNTIDIINYLIAEGIDINHTSRNRSTALMHFSSKPNADIQIIKILLDAGADINARDKGGNTAMAYALSASNLEIAKELRARGGR